jgi:hypothetical protein
MMTVALAAWLGAVLAASGAEAQTRPAPAPAQEQIQQQMDMMGPAMAKMMENMYGGMLRALAKPESAEQLATFMKNYRDALVAKGFSPDEAMQIVKGTGMPTMPASK